MCRGRGLHRLRRSPLHTTAPLAHLTEQATTLQLFPLARSPFARDRGALGGDVKHRKPLCTFAAEGTRTVLKVLWNHAAATCKCL
jgi:hypothetical protein